MIQKGVLLTKTSIDYSNGSHIILWLSSDQGPCKLVIPHETSVFFIHSVDAERVSALLKPHFALSMKPLALKTFQQEAVTGVYFKQQRYFYDAQKILAKANIARFEYDIRLCDRYLMERFVYGSMAFSGRAIQHPDFTEYHDVKIKSDDYLPTLSKVSLDIECSMEGELYCIGLHSEDRQTLNKVIMIGKGSEHPFIQWVDSEKALLLALQESIHTFNPDIIIGWNVVDFDFRVLLDRAKVHQLPLLLGRDGSPCQWRENADTEQGFITIAGRVVIDGISALKTASYQFPSFSLQTVSEALLGKQKLIDKPDNRVETITEQFQHDKLALAQYNIHDCHLVSEIFNYTKVLEFLVFRSQITGLELDRQGGSVAAFTQLYLPKLHRAGYIAPNLPAAGGLASPGGYVMNSQPGIYHNVVVLDYKSLYPSIIRTFKIDPLGLIEGLLDKESAIPGFREAFFSRERHILPNIITSLWQQRDHAKKVKDQAKSQALKLIMNSFYGVLGSGGCRFYDTKLASSITLRGHEVIKQTQIWLEQLGYPVIYGDTDSLFILLDKNCSSSQASAIANELVTEINESWRHKLDQEQQIESHLEIEFDQHYLRFFMPTIRGSEEGSKKRYAGLIKQPNRNEYEIIFKGLESVRTDWTLLARDFQRELFEHIFHDKDPMPFIITLINDIRQGKHDTKLIYRKRLRQKLSHYIKNVPPHVKAARMADNANLQLGKPLQYQNKGWIEYIITTQGPEPTEFQQNPLDYSHYIEKQIMPIAEAVLPLLGIHLERELAQQQDLFL